MLKRLASCNFIHRNFPKLGIMLLPVWDKKPDIDSGFYSQYGQDHWVVDRVFPESSKKGFFIEMGAGDGILISNTAVLEKKYGWTGLLIEPTDKFDQLKENRSATCIKTGISSEEGNLYLAAMPGPGYMEQDPSNTLRTMAINANSIDEAREQLSSQLPSELKGSVAETQVEIFEVRCTTMLKVLSETSAPSTIDYLSLDVEGHEYEVLRNFPFDSYRISSMNIERPGNKLHRLLLSKQYIPVAKNHCGDIFYIHDDMSQSYFSFTGTGSN